MRGGGSTAPSVRSALAVPTILALLSILSVSAAPAAVLDRFEDTTAWTARASPGVSAEVALDQGHTGMAMRVDFDFHGGGGYVIVRRELRVDLPANFAFTFFVRGQAPRNTFEMKLVDTRGDNVWWTRQPDYSPPLDWQQLAVKKPRFQFAWGSGGPMPDRIGAIEFAIVAGQGGKGSVWLDELKLEEREPLPRDGLKARPLASTSSMGHEPAAALDGDPSTSWHSGALAPQQWLLLDFGGVREYGGLVIDWDPEDYATAYDVQISDDGQNYTTVQSVRSGNGGRDYIYLYNLESRFVRLDLQRSSREQGYGIRQVAVKPFAFSASPNRFFEEIARDSPPGWFPKYFYGRQTYWTLVGVSGGHEEAIFNEEGALEVERGSFSIEPFLYADAELITWQQVETTQKLLDGYLPIPSVSWEHPKFRLEVLAFADGEPDASAIQLRYTVENKSENAADVSLFLAIRPFQVLPIWQDLNIQGGVSPIRTISSDLRRVWVNDTHTVVAVTPPDHFGAAAFEEGLLTDFLSRGKVPPSSQVNDSFGYASAALEYRFALAPRARAQAVLSVPLQVDSALADEAAACPSGEEANWCEARLDKVAHLWERQLGRVELVVPERARDLVDTLRTATAHILINRDGAAIQPGPRNYARAWIRDGADSSTALLAVGYPYEVREFLRWFARFQFADGRIPCCVDQRGADQVPEHDSNGQFVATVAEYYRFTRDVGFLVEMWPAVVRAVQSIDALRQERRTETYRRPDKLAFYGLLPESISHEGYSSQPVHSYWDDFWALRGLRGAVLIARTLGEEEMAEKFAAIRDSFSGDLFASIPRAMARSRIDYIPGSVELGDFDATSTSAAILGGVEIEQRFPEQVKRTYQRYWQNVRARVDPPAQAAGKAKADAKRKDAGGEPSVNGDGYTAYEFRNVEALVRLGERERAWQLLSYLMADRRPLAWRQWQEVTWRDPAAPRFIGDMPHTWIGAIFVSAVRSLFAYEDAFRDALVLAAGIPAEWLAEPGGVGVRRLPTHYGVLNYRLVSEAPNRLRLRMSGDVAVPPGGIVVRPPLPAPLKSVTIDGESIAPGGATHAVAHKFPAEIVMEW